MNSRPPKVLFATAMCAVVLGACVDQPVEPGRATTDLPAAVDSAVVLIEKGVDKAVALAKPDSAPAAARRPVQPVSQALVDSLRRQLASIESLVASLQTDSAVHKNSVSSGVDMPPTDSALAAEADTAAVVEPTKALKGVRNLGLRFFWASVFVVMTVLFLRTIQWILERSAERIVTRRLFLKKLIPIVRIITWMSMLFVIVRYVFDIGGGELVAAGAAVGVAVGFAAQDVLKNIFGGILIILDQPFQVGDKINVGGTYGEVVAIGLRSTRIVTPDDNLVTVPNTQVVDGQVANANAGALDCQVVTDLYLPGWVDVAKAKEIAFNAAANSKYVYLEKPIVVLVKDEFKETFLSHILVKAYVLDTRFESVFASDVTETAKSEYLRLGMLYPFAPPLVPLTDENGVVPTTAAP